MKQISTKRLRPTPKQWTQQEIDLLQANYNPSIPRCAIALSKSLLSRFSPREISGKAYCLGVTQKRWSDAEEELLEAVAETMSIDDLAKYWRRQAEKRGLPTRSKESLKIKINRLGYSQKPVSAGVNAKVLARGLGIAPKVVFNWVKTGKLKTKWVGEKGGERLITWRNLARFVFQYPAEFRDLRMDGDSWVWLLQQLAETCSIKN